MWSDRSERGRGRPHSSRCSASDRANLTYLARISIEHGFDLKTFLERIHSAWRDGQASYKTMTVTCRKKYDGYAVFLIKAGERLIAQLKLHDKTLDNIRDVSQSDLGLDEMKIRARRKRLSAEMKIKDLAAGMRNFKLRGKVIEKSASKQVYSRWGEPVNFSSVMISDETGTIAMPLWGNQADSISLGDAILVEGASTKKYAGELQIRIGRGKLTVLK